MLFERRVLTAEEIVVARDIANAKNARGVIARVDWTAENPQCPLCYAHLDENGDCRCGINKDMLLHSKVQMLSEYLLLY